MAQWIDFRALRAQLKITDVLAEHGITLKVNRDQGSGFCPLPDHAETLKKNRSPSFSANLKKGIWQCFGCKQSGNALDLAVLLASKDPDDPQAVRSVAVELVRRFKLDAAGDVKRSRGKPPRSAVTARPDEPAGVQPEGRESSDSKPPLGQPPAAAFQGAPHCDDAIVNPPLDFELKHLDTKHPYLASRGLTPATVEHFGLGYCAKGFLAGRIAIPIHNPQGLLVGYAGRLVDDGAIAADCPKYLLPGRRDRGGRVIEFHKSELLYNAHGVEKQGGDVIVVEGFPSVWHLVQCGFANTLAVMGSDCSDRQLQLILDCCDADATVWLFPDDDRAGEKFATGLAPRLVEFRRTRWIRDRKHQPTDYTHDELQSLLESVRR